MKVTTIGAVEIINDDTLIALGKMASDSMDCCVTDPPYGKTSLKWDKWVEGWPDEVLRIIKPSGSMWVFGTFRMFTEHWAEFGNWKLSQDIIWEKQNGTGLFNDRFRRVHEMACHFYPKKSKWRDVFKQPQHTFDATKRTIRKKSRPPQWIGATGDTVYQSADGGPRLMRSVIHARNEHGRAIHPTQKPVALVEPMVLYSCPEGGTVLDPFSGSGTTGVVANRHCRKAVLVEGDEEFVRLSLKRIKDDQLSFKF